MEIIGDDLGREPGLGAPPSRGCLSSLRVRLRVLVMSCIVGIKGYKVIDLNALSVLWLKLDILVFLL